MFAKNLADLRKEKRITQENVAKSIGISRSTYADYESGKSEPVISVLKKMASFFQVSMEELAEGQVPLPLFRHPEQKIGLLNKNIRILPVTVTTKQRENIQHVPIVAQAGYVSEYNQPEFISQLPYFNLPKLNDNFTYRAFEINGDSMPPIHSGYILVGQYVVNEKDIKNGKRYVLVTKSDGVVFKKVIRDSTRQPRLLLMSDNPEIFTYSIELADVLEAWEMVAFIGYPNIYQEGTPLLNERLQKIERKIDTLIHNP